MGSVSVNHRFLNTWFCLEKMPKSKRDKKISLTQTRKKGLDLKQKVIEEIRDTVDNYARIFTFSVHHMRNNKLKDIRTEWKHSRFHFGKNKLLGVALGRTPEDEYRDNLHKISSRLWGQTGLLFTNAQKDEVLKWFDSYSEPDYARSGNGATQTVILEKGPLPEFPHSMEPQLRQLGLPTSLDKGVVTLLRDHQVCQDGQTLSPEQARILKLFGYQMAEFKMRIDGMWQNDGTIEFFKNDKEESIVGKTVKIKPSKPNLNEASDDEDVMEDDEDDS